MAFALESLALKPDTVLHLRHPVSDDLLYEDTAEGKVPVTVSLYGTASKQYRNATNSAANRHLRRQARKEKPDAEVMSDESIEVLVACSITSTLEREGAPVDSEAAFRAMYKDQTYSWVRSQVDSAIMDTSNFLTQ